MTPEQKRKFGAACIAAAVVIVIDQTSKALALAMLSTDNRIPLLGDLFGLQLAFNPGAILSLGAGSTWLLTIVGVVAVGFLIAATMRVRTGIGAVGLGLVLGGAVGNLIDRLIAPPGFGVGHVTDFLAYGTLFIGNLADVALGAGAVLLFIGAWRKGRNSGTSAPAEPSEPTQQPEVQAS